MSNHQARRARVSALVWFIGLGVFGASRYAVANQLISGADCHFVMHVPGILGGTNLHLKMQKGAVFNENADRKFCGPVTEATPFGESPGNKCFIVHHGNLVSGEWSDKVTSSNCTLIDAASLQVPFKATDFAAWAGHGPATLKGQAFLKTVGGDIKTCAGARVLLLPATRYVQELLTKANAKIAVHADPRLASYAKRTICDAQGNFTFSHLPAQQWYVITSVTWGVPEISDPGSQPPSLASALLGIQTSTQIDKQGGELIKKVALSAGDNQIFLTYRNEQ